MDNVWPELGEKEIRYHDEIWELTGEVDVQDQGELLAVDATARDDVGHERRTLYFALQGESDALNPGNLGGHFDRLERTKRNQYLVVETEGRTYRYRLDRIGPA